MGETQENKDNNLEIQFNNAAYVEPKKKTKKIIAGISVLVVLVILSGAVIAFNSFKKHQELLARQQAVQEALAQQQAEKEKIEEYNTHIENLNLLYSSSLSGAGTAESVCVLTCNVWQDAIYGNSSDETQKYVSGTADFNEALQRVYNDQEIKEKLNGIKDDKEKSNKYIQNLQSCPEELNKAYDIALQVNTAFSSLADLALTPTGSYNTYSQSEHEKVDAFITSCTTLRAVIPSKKEVPLYNTNGDRVKDQFAFDIYLNQLSDKLPDTVDDSGASIMGIYKDSATICGYEGEVSYFTNNDLVRSISWEVETIDNDSLDKIVRRLRHKYGEENLQDDTSYSWSDNLACNILVQITDKKTKITWLSAL